MVLNNYELSSNCTNITQKKAFQLMVNRSLDNRSVGGVAGLEGNWGC